MMEEYSCLSSFGLDPKAAPLGRIVAQGFLGRTVGFCVSTSGLDARIILWAQKTF